MMKGQILLRLMLGVTLLFSAAATRAQEAAPPPPHIAMMQAESGGDMMFSGPMAGPVELLGFAGIHGGKVVKGAPFIAESVSSTTQTLADGNVISQTTKTKLYRDSQGRFRKDMTIPAIGPLATAGSPKSFVTINDPVAQTNFVLHPESKTAEKMDHAGRGMRWGAKNGATNDAMGGKFHTHMQEEIANGTLKSEDLGTQMIAGVNAHGTRITRTIPAGQIGNQNPITIVSEHWYSPDLQMTVMSKRSDPRFGETTYTLTYIQQSEPDAKLFTVPADYSVTSGGHRAPLMQYRRMVPPSPSE